MAILKIRDNDGNVTEVAALKGTGISKIEKTATNGLIDTYTITLTDGTTSTFTVTNGASGSADIVIDTALSNTSTNPVQNKAITARVNALQGNLNDFIAEVPDLIRQRTLCVGVDEQGEQVTHSVAQIYQHVQDGGQVILLHPDYPDTYFTLTEITEGYVYFGGKMSDDNFIWRFEYTDEGIYEYESSIVTGPQLQEIDITQEQQWTQDETAIARTNIGLDDILGIDSNNNYRQVSVTDMTFTLTDDVERDGEGVGIYLSQHREQSHDPDASVVEALEFYGLLDDEKVRLKNIAPGEERYDAVTLGQLDEVRDQAADKSEGTFYIEGSGTTDSTAKTSTWTGTSDRVTAYYDGLAIRYKIGVVGQSTVTLNINNLGAKTVYRFNTTKLTTQFPVGSIITLIYHTDLNGGCWITNDYDANTNTQQRVYESSTKNVEYPLTARYATTTGNAYYAEYGRYTTGVTLNPSTKTITATAFKGKLTGNADTATKATQDANGNVIADTYETKENVTSKIDEVNQNFGPTISQVQTGLGALSALFDPELMQNGITEADEGKFLRVVNGKLTLVSIPNAEDGEF